MNRTDAIAQLEALRGAARLAAQAHVDPGTAAADAAALGMAIKALRAPNRRRMPIWACVMWCVAAAAIVVACVAYAMA